MALIDGVRDSVISSLKSVPAHSESKRSFRINTLVVAEPLHEFLTDYLDLYLNRDLKPNWVYVSEYLSTYAFSERELDDIIEAYGISKKEFTQAYNAMLRGFKVLYEDDYT